MLERWPRRLAAALALGGALAGLWAGPAAADAPAPTNFRSEVVSVEPPTDAVTVSVVGGDSFLVLDVDRGHSVEVPGYSGEPYLRFRPDGTVQENQASAAAYLNASRDRRESGRTFDPETPPRWKTVATDGRWGWHDHRIHHMGGPVPSDARAGGHEWNVPIVVDGREVDIEGRYRLLGAPSPWPWILLAIAVGIGIVVGAARSNDPVGVAGAAMIVAGIGGVVGGVAQRGAGPPGAPASVLVVVLPALALVAGVIAVMQRGRVLRATAALAGAAAAGGWAVIRLPVLWNAVLPTDLSPVVDRAVTAVALGAAAGAAIAVLRSGALSPPAVASERGGAR